MIIAIDGPAASGKGTLSRRLADHFGLRHLDTGLTYRAVAAALLAKGLPLGDEPIAIEIARNLDLAQMDKSVLSATRSARPPRGSPYSAGCARNWSTCSGALPKRPPARFWTDATSAPWCARTRP